MAREKKPVHRVQMTEGKHFIKFIFCIPKCYLYDIIILLTQNSRQLMLSCRRFAAYYIGNPWLENQMPAMQSLGFLRTWYNDSAYAEFKKAYIIGRKK